MKYLFSILLIAIVQLSAGQNSKSTHTEEDKFSVVFYNTENLFDIMNDPKTEDDDFTPGGSKKWTHERYEKKLNDIAKVLSSTNPDGLPDIIGLAEVENRTVLNDLLDTKFFANGYYGIIHKDSPDIRGIDVALLYNPKAFQLLYKTFIPVYFPFDRKSKVRDILYAKGISGQDTLHLFVNHWKSRAGGRVATKQKRVFSARILKTRIDSILSTNSDAKIIAMGDFNDEPENKSLSGVLQAKNPEEVNHSNALYNLMYPKDKQGAGTYNYDYEWYMLDNLIVSQACLTGRKGYTISTDNVYIYNPPWVLYDHPKAGMEVPNKTYGGDNYYGGISDHLAIYGVFTNKN